MPCNQNKALPCSFFFAVILRLMSCCPVILLAHEYRYTEAGKASSTSNTDKLAIVQNHLLVELPAALQLHANASLFWQHSYTQLQQDIANPLHNGHLHHSRIRWKANEHRDSPWRHDWSLGLAMSSNRFKNFEPDKDALALEGRTLRVFPLSKTLSGLAGIQANYLYNRYRVLPDMGLQWQSPIGEFAMGTQRFSWSYDSSARRRISVNLARAASKWFAEDNDSGRESEIYLRKNMADISYRFDISSDWAVSLGLGYTQVRQLNFQENSAGPTAMKFKKSPVIGLALVKL